VVEQDQPSRLELGRIQDRLIDFVKPDTVWMGGTDERRGRVDATVTVLTEELQRRADEEFGPGLVHLRGALHPVD
jgi:hypothetical protein